MRNESFGFCFLRKYKIRFLRQKVINSYIVDFYCSEAKVVVELDGEQHYDGKTEAKDKIRDEKLMKLGLKVLRFSNLEINQNFQAVCEYIDKIVEDRVEKGNPPVYGVDIPL